MLSLDKERKYVTWLDVERMVREIVDHVIVSGIHIDAILGIARGGLIPAAMIAYHYGLRKGVQPSVDCAYASSYGSLGEQGDLVVGHIPTARRDALRRHEVLIIDDIADSGATLSYFLKEFKRAHTAVLIHKTQSSVKPDFYGLQDEAGDRYWWVLPWER